jgi:hypothetical protein
MVRSPMSFAVENRLLPLLILRKFFNQLGGPYSLGAYAVISSKSNSCGTSAGDRFYFWMGRETLWNGAMRSFFSAHRYSPHKCRHFDQIVFAAQFRNDCATFYDPDSENQSRCAYRNRREDINRQWAAVLLRTKNS